VIIVAVEPADCLTVGGAISPAVQEAIPKVISLVQGQVARPSWPCHRRDARATSAGSV
jgi:hypothetical protein